MTFLFTGSSIRFSACQAGARLRVYVRGWSWKLEFLNVCKSSTGHKGCCALLAFVLGLCFAMAQDGGATERMRHVQENLRRGLPDSIIPTDIDRVEKIVTNADNMNIDDVLAIGAVIRARDAHGPEGQLALTALAPSDETGYLFKAAVLSLLHNGEFATCARLVDERLECFPDDALCVGLWSWLERVLLGSPDLYRWQGGLGKALVAIWLVRAEGSESGAGRIRGVLGEIPPGVDVRAQADAWVARIQRATDDHDRQWQAMYREIEGGARQGVRAVVGLRSAWPPNCRSKCLPAAAALARTGRDSLLCAGGTAWRAI
jgi:hypothetical protein